MKEKIKNPIKAYHQAQKDWEEKGLTADDWGTFKELSPRKRLKIGAFAAAAAISIAAQGGGSSDKKETSRHEAENTPAEIRQHDEASDTPLPVSDITSIQASREDGNLRLTPVHRSDEDK